MAAAMDVEGDAGAMEVEHDVVAELGATHTLLQERAECSRRYLQQLIACSSAIIDAKRSGNTDGVSALRTRGHVLLAALRANNRDAQMCSGSTDKKLASIRSRMASEQQGLEGVLYEREYYAKAEAHNPMPECVLESMEVVSAGDLDPTVRESVTEGSHEWKMALLAMELTRRKEMQEKLAELKKEKQRLVQENGSKQSFLKSLNQHLLAIEKAAKPLAPLFQGVENYCAVPEEEVELADALPTPLYTLYYAASSDPALPQVSTHITGNIEVARAFNEKLRSDGNSSAFTSSGAPDRHPLRVLMKIGSCCSSVQGAADHSSYTTTNTATVNLKFSYYPSIRCVGVFIDDRKTQKELPEVLVNLFPADTGTFMPIRGAIDVQVSQLNGYAPYIWAQRLAGLKSMKPPELHKTLNAPPEPKSLSTAPTSLIGDVVLRLHDRVEAQRVLLWQLKCLEKCVIPGGGSSALKCELRKWEPYSLSGRALEQFRKETDRDGSSAAWEHAAASYYRAVFRRDKNEDHLEATVEITAEYPMRPPTFRLALVPPSSGSDRPSSAALPPHAIPSGVTCIVDKDALKFASKVQSATSTALVDLEKDINGMGFQADLRNERVRSMLLLGRQVHELCSRLDRFLTELSSRGNDATAAERNHSGRDRHVL